VRIGQGLVGVWNWEGELVRVAFFLREGGGEDGELAEQSKE
jgi:hypothetical protein